MVWLPIVEQQSGGWNDNMQRQFESLQSTMSWYSIYHPSLVPKALIWFLRKEWKYKTKPILVVLDRQGRVLCHNALHMMWIWGTYAFPFTSAREEALWREETWRLDLLVDGIDAEILNWIQEDKYVILYGSIDVDWVRKFLKEARRVGVAAQVPLEMVYVGKSNSIEQVRRVLDTVVLEKLPTHYWLVQSMIWFFWARLESMLFSKFQLQQADDHDIVMQEIQKLLCYDKHDGCFILAKGFSILVNGLANTGLQTLMEYDMWKEQADREGYGLAFEQHYRKLHTVVAAPCCRFEFSEAMGRIPDKLRCPECQRQMRILTTFQCRHDDNVDDPMSIAAFRRPTI
ncbi:hypothetical protein L6164_005043 [Bauhinia variegata]|uniref:Uncharacterized protein n=1 Tax=Bauhinia variegata TaxID=167791 RepID=A0ACB9PQ30_BAUVA|nr:hypothetical protein L6164_005043 [Bauhinia variegata]